MSRLVRFHTCAWRERYEPELVELMAARPPSVADRLDLIRVAGDGQPIAWIAFGTMLACRHTLVAA